MPWGYNEHHTACCYLKDKLFDEIQKAVQHGYNHFIFGAALGIDIYVGELLILLRKLYPHITIEAAVPCTNQSEKWQKRYVGILSLCDTNTIISNNYTPSCIQDRNKYMVDNSSLLIAVWNGKPGGTANTIEYAKSKNVETIIIALT